MDNLKRQFRENWGVILALGSLYFIWGSTYLAIRFAIAGFPPLLMAGLRFLMGGTLLFIFLKIRGEPTPTRAQWIGAGLVGTLLLAGGNGGVSFAEQWVSSGLAATWVATTPVWAALFSGLWGRWPSKVEWLGLALGFTGVVILNFEGDLRANPVGAIILTLATGCWAFGSIWSKHLSLPKGPMSSAAQMLSAAALLLPLGLISGERITNVPDTKSILALLYLVVFGSLIAYSTYVFLLRTVRPALATSYAYVNPVVAVLLGVLLGGEKIGVVGVIAMFIILGGVVLVTLGGNKKS